MGLTYQVGSLLRLTQALQNCWDEPGGKLNLVVFLSVFSTLT